MRRKHFQTRIEKTVYEAALLDSDGAEIELNLENQHNVIATDSYEDSLVDIGNNDIIQLKIKTESNTLDPTDPDYDAMARQLIEDNKNSVVSIINNSVNASSLITSNGTASVTMSATEKCFGIPS